MRSNFTKMLFKSFCSTLCAVLIGLNLQSCNTTKDRYVGVWECNQDDYHILMELHKDGSMVELTEYEGVVISKGTWQYRDKPKSALEIRFDDQQFDINERVILFEKDNSITILWNGEKLTFKRCKDINGNPLYEHPDIKKSSLNSTNQQETVQPERPKQIQWKDGNTYNYDFTEQIESKDSTGKIVTITVYKQKKPNDNQVNCQLKSCKWCGRQVQAVSYAIIEYPNINGFRDQSDIGSIFELMFTAAFGFMNSEYMNHFDLENNRIRTEWRQQCNYPGVGEFCSLKCESEYKNRGY